MSPAHHHSVHSRINYDSCICLSHNFEIYVVGMIIKLLSSRLKYRCSTSNWLDAMLSNIFGINYYN